MADISSGFAEPVTVGKVLAPHGVLGELRVEIYSDVPHRFAKGSTIYIHSIPYRILASTAARARQCILSLEGVDTRSQAQQLQNAWITVPTHDAPTLPQGEYFHFQLIGLGVVTEEGERLGQITRILETGSNDVYVISGEGSELLIPAVRQVVREVRLSEGIMVVRLLEGLR